MRKRENGTSERATGRADGQRDEQTSNGTSKRATGRANEQRDEQRDEWRDEWTTPVARRVDEMTTSVRVGVVEWKGDALMAAGARQRREGERRRRKEGEDDDVAMWPRKEFKPLTKHGQSWDLVISSSPA